MNSIFVYVLLVGLLLQIQFAMAADNVSTPPLSPGSEVKEEKGPSADTQRDFASLHSFGYRPNQSKMNIDFALQNANLDYSVFVQSTSSSKLTKWYDSKHTRSYLFTSFQYGLDENTRFGVKLENVVSSNSKYTYTTDAKATGKNDYSVSRKGGKEPTFSFDRTFKETNDLRVFGFLSYSPKVGKSSDSNVFSGGSATDLGFQLVKMFEKTEFLFGIAYKIYGLRSYEEGTSKSETKDGNDLGLNVGLNLRTSKNSSFVVSISRTMTDFSTITYENSSTPTEIDSYAQTSYIVGYQFSMAEDLLFQIGYAGYIVEEAILRSGTQTIVIDPYTGGGLSFGMKIAF
jgi:hypothetical protein